MPIFISYSHSDAAFVNKLAAHLVKHNAHVWVDSWELNVGDSILSRVQEAIRDSSALLIVLSKASVVSEWCKKELNAGLMRELDEKRVVVLPVLVENCDIPLFLRDKMYADFRTSFAVGLKALVEAVSRVTNIDQGRLRSENVNIDWAEAWGYADELFGMEYTLIEFSPDRPFTLLTEIGIKCNEVATYEYREYEEHGIDWLGRIAITEALTDLADSDEIRVILEDQLPKIAEYRLHNRSRNAEYDVTIRCRRMGEDNGKNQLVNVTDYLRKIRDYVRTVARKPTAEELARMMQLVSKF